MVCMFFFFFQAEDGIRDGRVTGVQTCALPICSILTYFHHRHGAPTVSVVDMRGWDGTSPQDGAQLPIIARLELTEFMASRIPQRKSLLVAVCGMLGSFKIFVFERTAPGLSKVPRRCVNSCAESCPRVL